jgi:adenine-specific DNA glycosylase
MVAPKKVITELTHTGFLIRDRGQILMFKNSTDQWWAGLWDLPRVDVTNLASFQKKSVLRGDVAAADADWLAAQLNNQYGVECSIDQHHHTIKHAVTRYRITLHTFNANIVSRPKRNPNLAWHRPASALDLPLTAPAKKILTSL